MCGRVILSQAQSEIAGFLRATLFPEQSLDPDYNLTPSKDLYIAVDRRSDDQPVERALEIARWGLVPSWAKDPSIGNKLTLNVTATLDSITAAGATWNFSATSPDNVGAPQAVIGSGSFFFDTNGQFISATTPEADINLAGVGVTTPQKIEFDFQNLTALAAPTSTFLVSHQDGFPPGQLNGYTIGADGIITGAYNNGLTQPLGQLALATFKNQGGLSDNGGNVYSATAASGTAIVGTPGQFSAGTLQSGALEMSNVDLSKEFTNLIVASTGFSASSRVISTSNQLIQDLLNSAR